MKKQLVHYYFPTAVLAVHRLARKCSILPHCVENISVPIPREDAAFFLRKLRREQRAKSRKIESLYFL